MTAQRPATWNARRFRVVAAALALTATVGGCEAVLAVLGLPRDADSAPESAAEVRAVVDPRAYVVDPKLHWRMLPHASLEIPELAFRGVRTDARGLRGADRDDEFRKSRLRVLCLGDSVVFGLNLEEEQSFPSRLESALRSRFPADVAPVVINAGVPGFSSVQGMRLLDELAPLEPDVVVWWFGMNDGKPALGAPDATLRMPAPGDGGLMSLLRGLRSVRFAESLARRARGDTTRVTTDEVRAEVAALTARAAAGGPAPVFVRSPSRLVEKLAQLGSIASAARVTGASRVDGAAAAVSQYLPGPPGCTDVVRTEDRAEGRTAILAAAAGRRVDVSLDEVLRRRDFVAKWKRAVDAYLEQMPADALGYTDLFGNEAPSDVFFDNCHLTASGARWAAETTAARIAEIVARRGMPSRK